MRTAKPWYRKQKDAWCVYFGGKLVTLANGKGNKKQAVEKFHQLMLHGGQVEESKLSLAQVCDRFLEHSKKSHSDTTFQQNLYFLQWFCRRYGNVRVAKLKAQHLKSWLETTTLGPTSRNKAIGTVKWCFNWAVGEAELLKENPFRFVKKPRARRRERILTSEERKLLFGNDRGKWFHDFLICLEESGARPGEIASLQAAHIDWERQVAILWKHKTAEATGKPRLIFLTEKMAEVLKRRCQQYPTGPLFLTIGGTPVTKNVLNCRFRRLRQKYPQLAGVSAYTLRHSFATSALEKGVPLAAVKELMGHSESSEILERVYAHLSQRADYLGRMATIAASAV